MSGVKGGISDGSPILGGRMTREGKRGKERYRDGGDTEYVPFWISPAREPMQRVQGPGVNATSQHGQVAHASQNSCIKQARTPRMEILVADTTLPGVRLEGKGVDM